MPHNLSRHRVSNEGDRAAGGQEGKALLFPLKNHSEEKKSVRVTIDPMPQQGPGWPQAASLPAPLEDGARFRLAGQLPQAGCPLRAQASNL